MTDRNQRGFTFIELMIAIMVGSLTTFLFSQNIWYTDDGAFKQLQAERPTVERLIKTERKLIFDSVIVVDEQGERTRYCLDTNILFNYTIEPCDPSS